MDRIDAMKVFITALDEGSLAAAARKLGRSPAAVTRALTFLENHIGVQLLHRSTRALRLSEAGERYASACRRILIDIEEADLLAESETKAPRGLLTVTAPITSGAGILRPILDDYLDLYPTVRAKLLLLDRIVSLVDEGIDVALRIAHLTDSSVIAIRVGEVRRLLCASPSYLDNNPPIREIVDLAGHQCIANSQLGETGWSFPSRTADRAPRVVRFTPRLIANGIAGTLPSAVEGKGVTRAYSYQIAEHVERGELRILLPDDEEPPIPVHLVIPEGRLSTPRVRTFVDYVVPRLKAEFNRRNAICARR
ncbi:MAG: LysR family transcriptional regulator [Thalassospira sp.]|nr:LysR family transcriptional regulator [Thalassospira sp.]